MKNVVFSFFKTIDIHRPVSANVVDNKINDWTFHLDGIFHNVSQEEIFNAVAKDIVDRALDGYNGQFESRRLLCFCHLFDVFLLRNRVVLRTDGRRKNSHDDGFR
jgi:hypothetical protein